METSDHWCHLGTIAEEALALGAERRTDYLDRICGPDASLRQQVEKLLTADRRAGQFLEIPAVDRLAHSQRTCTEAEPIPWIGSYRILRRLGAGGVGEVFLAKSVEDPEGQPVAIKVLRQLPNDRDARRSFLAEREMLAQLRHANIVRLFENGVSADRRPYLVMEYVDGLPIDAYCRRHRLPLTERLALFRQLCAAIHFAHQQQIVHRDLKPSNILVDTEGHLKLLDFSIAKRISAHSAPSSPKTKNLPMTLSYASPEQIRGQPVTVATDVHGLGIVLYRLLTEQHPLPVDGKSLYRAAEIVCSHPPLAPSRAISHPRLEADNSAQSAQWRRNVAGELDAMVLKALEKRPGDRYASANHLAADLKRWERQGLGG